MKREKYRDWLTIFCAIEIINMIWIFMWGWFSLSLGHTMDGFMLLWYAGCVFYVFQGLGCFTSIVLLRRGIVECRKAGWKATENHVKMQIVIAVILLILSIWMIYGHTLADPFRFVKGGVTDLKPSFGE